ncbi:MAG: response regulator [Lachnospiraceae bacterium]|nr:response regulator [Lachnospiraceae bacterium]
MGSEKKTILIIDDMATILEHAKQILKDSYKVIPCTSGKQGLEIFDKMKPDLVLVDINMPDMDGFQVLSEIRNRAEGREVPVIMMTTGLTSDIESKGFRAGVDDFLIKPFSQPAVIKRVSMQLDTRPIDD